MTKSGNTKREQVVGGSHDPPTERGAVGRPPHNVASASWFPANNQGLHSPRSPNGFTARRGGITLIELLIAIAVMAILAAAVIPTLEPNVYSQLIGAAQVAQAELGYARNMAVTNDSRYTLAFDKANNRIVLTHSGTNAVLNTLPASPFRNISDPATQQITDFDELPAMYRRVELIVGQKVSTVTTTVTDVEFGPLGETTRPETTRLWLGCGEGNTRLYVPITIDPVTGLASIGEVTKTAPAGSDPVPPLVPPTSPSSGGGGSGGSSPPPPTGL